MSQNAKIAVGVAVVLVLAVFGYYWYQHEAKPEGADDVFTNASTTLPSGTSTSDRSLNQDLAAIDAQLTGLSSDQAAVNSSVEESGQTQ